MIKVFINSSAVSFEETLGVLLFHNRQLLKLQANKNFKIYLVNNDMAAGNQKLPDEWKPFDKSCISEEKAKSLAAKGDAVEILLHQFQQPILKCRRILFAFDLHIHDLAWKYQSSNFRQLFIDNLKSSHSVITMFPRTYFDLERVLGVSLQNFFLVSSPLMNDISNSPQTKAKLENSLLYPAQLQVHKNHVGLLEGLRHYIQNGGKIDKMYFTGSKFYGSGINLEQKIAELELGNVATFLGKLSTAEFHKVYKKVKGIIVPSVAEGGAYVALEGIAAKKAVAANNIRSAKMHAEMYDAQINWFEAQDVTQVSDAIHKLLTCDLAEENQKNHTARETILRDTWEAQAAQVGKVIEFVTGKAEKPLMEISRNLQLCGDPRP